MPTEINLTSKYQESNSTNYQFRISSDVLNTPQVICGVDGESFSVEGVSYHPKINKYKWELQGILVNVSETMQLKVFSGSTLLADLPITSGNMYSFEGLRCATLGDDLKIETSAPYSNLLLTVSLGGS